MIVVWPVEGGGVEAHCTRCDRTAQLGPECSDDDVLVHVGRHDAEHDRDECAEALLRTVLGAELIETRVRDRV